MSRRTPLAGQTPANPCNDGCMNSPSENQTANVCKEHLSNDITQTLTLAKSSHVEEFSKREHNFEPSTSSRGSDFDSTVRTPGRNFVRTFLSGFIHKIVNPAVNYLIYLYRDTRILFRNLQYFWDNSGSYQASINRCQDEILNHYGGSFFSFVIMILTGVMIGYVTAKFFLAGYFTLIYQTAFIRPVSNSNSSDHDYMLDQIHIIEQKDAQSLNVILAFCYYHIMSFFDGTPYEYTMRVLTHAGSIFLIEAPLFEEVFKRSRLLVSPRLRFIFFLLVEMTQKYYGPTPYIGMMCSLIHLVIHQFNFTSGILIHFLWNLFAISIRWGDTHTLSTPPNTPDVTTIMYALLNLCFTICISYVPFTYGTSVISVATACNCRDICFCLPINPFNPRLRTTKFCPDKKKKVKLTRADIKKNMQRLDKKNKDRQKVIKKSRDSITQRSITNDTEFDEMLGIRSFSQVEKNGKSGIRAHSNLKFPCVDSNAKFDSVSLDNFQISMSDVSALTDLLAAIHIIIGGVNHGDYIQVAGVMKLYLNSFNITQAIIIENVQKSVKWISDFYDSILSEIPNQNGVSDTKKDLTDLITQLIQTISGNEDIGIYTKSRLYEKAMKIVAFSSIIPLFLIFNVFPDKASATKWFTENAAMKLVALTTIANIVIFLKEFVETGLPYFKGVQPLNTLFKTSKTVQLLLLVDKTVSSTYMTDWNVDNKFVDGSGDYTQRYICHLDTLEKDLELQISVEGRDNVTLSQLRGALKALRLYSGPIKQRYNANNPAMAMFAISLVSGTNCQKSSWVRLLHQVAWRHLHDMGPDYEFNPDQVVNVSPENARMDTVVSSTLIINIDDADKYTLSAMAPGSAVNGNIMNLKQGAVKVIDKAKLEEKGTEFFRPVFATICDNSKDHSQVLINHCPDAARRRFNLHILIRAKNNSNVGIEFDDALSFKELGKFYKFQVQRALLDEKLGVVYQEVRSQRIDESNERHNKFMEGDDVWMELDDLILFLDEEFGKYYEKQRKLVKQTQLFQRSKLCKKGCGFNEMICMCHRVSSKNVESPIVSNSNEILTWSMYFFNIFILFMKCLINFNLLRTTIAIMWNNSADFMISGDNIYFNLFVSHLPGINQQIRIKVIRKSVGKILSDAKGAVTQTYHDSLGTMHPHAKRILLILSGVASAMLLKHVLTAMCSIFSSGDKTPADSVHNVEKVTANKNELTAENLAEANLMINAVGGKAMDRKKAIIKNERKAYAITQRDSDYPHVPTNLRDKISRVIKQQTRRIMVSTPENDKVNDGNCMIVAAGLILAPYHYFSSLGDVAIFCLTISTPNTSNVTQDNTVQIRSNQLRRIVSHTTGELRDLCIVPLGQDIFGGANIIKYMQETDDDPTVHAGSAVAFSMREKEVLTWNIAIDRAKYPDTMTGNSTIGILYPTHPGDPGWGQGTCGALIVHTESCRIVGYHIANTIDGRNVECGISVLLFACEINECIKGIDPLKRGLEVNVLNEPLYINYSNKLLKLSKVSPNSCLLHLDENSYGQVLGTDNQLRNKRNDTRLEYTPLKGFTPVPVNMDLQNLKGYVDENGIWMDGIAQAILDSSFAPPSVNPDLFDLAWMDYYESNLSAIDFSECRVLTIEEAINGFGTLKPINLNTGAGAGWPGKKKDYVYRDIHGHSTPKPELIAAVHAFITDLSNGKCNNVIVTTFVKDELRKRGKVARAVNNPPIVYLIVMRMYLGMYTQTIIDARDLTEHAVGVNAGDPDQWMALYDRAVPTPESEYDSSNPDHTQTSAGDREGFDKFAQYGTRIKSANAKVIRVKCPMFTEEDNIIVSGLAIDTNNIIRSYEGDLIKLGDGTISGEFMTALWNCMVDSVVSRMTYQMCYVLQNPSRYEKNYWLHVYNVVPKFSQNITVNNYGDDNTLRRTNRVASFFNGKNIDVATRMLGVPTTDNKKRGYVSFESNLDNVDFLKRSFVIRDGLAYAPLDLSSIYKSLTCVNSESPLSKQDHMQLVIENSILQMFMHGREAFDSHMEWLRAVAFPILYESVTYSLVPYHNFSTYEEVEEKFLDLTYTELAV